jgi:hypothetical protein
METPWPDGKISGKPAYSGHVCHVSGAAEERNEKQTFFVHSGGLDILLYFSQVKVPSRKHSGGIRGGRRTSVPTNGNASPVHLQALASQVAGNRDIWTRTQ